MGAYNNGLQSKFGDFKIELPFDLEKRRVTAFTINDKADNNGKGT